LTVNPLIFIEDIFSEEEMFIFHYLAIAPLAL
jgi:hypothetical protein